MVWSKPLFRKQTVCIFHEINFNVCLIVSALREATRHCSFQVVWAHKHGSWETDNDLLHSESPSAPFCLILLHSFCTSRVCRRNRSQRKQHCVELCISDKGGSHWKAAVGRGWCHICRLQFLCCLLERVTALAGPMLAAGSRCWSAELTSVLHPGGSSLWLYVI